MGTRKLSSRRVLLAATGLFMALAACTGGGEAPGSETPSPPARAVIDWSSRPTTTVALDAGFGVKGCPGDAPFLCVERDGSAVGQIEYMSYPAPEGGEEALKRLIEDDYRQFTSDRTGCAEGFRVETVEPEEARVAAGSGLRSEYSVVNAEGDTVERYVKYWSLSDDRVHLLVAEAQEEESCSPGEGTAFSDEGLEEFESSFEDVAEASRFPAGGQEP